MKHSCPTSYHIEPSYVCHSTHGCRCVGCESAMRDKNRDRYRVPGTPLSPAKAEIDAPTADDVPVPLPSRVFKLAVDAAHREGTRPALWVADLIRENARVSDG